LGDTLLKAVKINRLVQSNSFDKLSQYFLILSFGLFAIAAAVGLFGFPFGDEAEKYVVAQLILDGHRLYGDIFAQHGPLAYMLAHGFGFISGGNFEFARLINIAISALVFWSFWKSPVFISKTHRNYSVGIFILLVSVVWNFQGIQFLLYHSLGGLLLLPFLFQTMLGQIVNRRPSKFFSYLSGFCAAFSILSSFTFIFAVAGLLVIQMYLRLFYLRAKFQDSLQLALGFCFGLMVGAAWLGFFGDFVGYIAYHIYVNVALYPKYVTNIASPANQDIFNQILQVLNMPFSFNAEPYNAVHQTLMTLFYMASAVFVFSSKPIFSKITLHRLLLVALLVLTLISLNLRTAVGYPDASLNLLCIGFLVSGLALSAGKGEFLNPLRIKKLTILSVTTVALASLFLVSYAISSPHQFKPIQFVANRDKMVPRIGGLYDQIRTMSNSHGGLFVITAQPIWYVITGAKPYSGNFAYMPYLAEYNLKPIFGHKTEICENFVTAPPAIVVVDSPGVWQYKFAEYAPCIWNFVQANFVNLDGEKNWLIRKELVHLVQHVDGPHF
jgi:hypothetical protein